MTNNKVNFTVSLPDDFYAKVRSLGDSLNLSRSEMLIELAQKGYEQYSESIQPENPESGPPAAV